MIQLNRFRISLCYVISTLLITTFVYSLISTNMENTRKLSRLREDIDEIALVVLHTPASGRTSQSLTDLVDKMLKKRLAGIWEELYALKKLFKAGGESIGIGADTAGTSTTNKGEGLTVKLNERVNYAAAELGARILNIKAEPMCSQNFLKSLMGMEFFTNPPMRMLRSTMEPGNCFAYKGDQAEVTLQLAHEILLDQVAVQHITQQQSPTNDTSSAPKDFQLVGIRGDFSEYSLGKYRFDNAPDRPLQYFNIAPINRYEYLKFQFETNHGHPNYTCIYRIAVFGKL